MSVWKKIKTGSNNFAKVAFPVYWAVNKAGIWDTMRKNKSSPWLTKDKKFNWGMVPFIGQGYTAQKNLEAQQEQQEYQRQLQQQMFDREDNSVARRIADLRANGLSPVLGAGQGASAGPVVSSQAPQREDTSGMIPALLMFMMNMMKMDTDVSKTVVQKDLIEAQTQKTYADTDNSRAQLQNILATLGMIKSNTSKNWIDYGIKKNDLDMSKRSFTNSNPGAVLNTMRNIQNILESEYGDKAPKTDPNKPWYMSQKEWEMFQNTLKLKGVKK